VNYMSRTVSLAMEVVKNLLKAHGTKSSSYTVTESVTVVCFNGGLYLWKK